MRVAGRTHSRSYPAVSASVPAARRALAGLAEAEGAGDDVVESVRLAASEALTNVVRHAYDGAPGEIYVTAATLANELWILISDEGRGLHARTDSPGLGLGLMLVSRVADDFSVVTRASGGTEVRMSFNLVRNASCGRHDADEVAARRGSISRAGR